MHPHTSDPTTLPSGIFNPPEDALALSGEAGAPGAGADEKKPVIWQDSCIGGESAMSPSEHNAHHLELLKQRSMAFEHIEDGIIVTSLEGVILDWNMGAQRLFGYSREEMLGKTPAVLHRPCDAEQLTDSINATASEHGRWKGDIHFVRKDGTSGICETTTVPMRDEQGRIFATLGINHDVTAQKAVEGKLVEEKQVLRTLIDALEDVIFFKDLEGRFILVNAAHRRFWGPSLKSPIGLTDFDFDGLRANAERYAQDDQTVIRTGKPITNREEPFTQADGTSGWFLTSKYPLHDSNGQIIGVVGTARDITEWRLTGRALADEREKSKTIVDALPDALFLKDREGRITLENKAMAKLFGPESGRVLKTAFEEPIPREYAERYAADDRSVIETGQPIVNREEPFLTVAGTTGYLLTSKYPIRDSSGEIVGVVGVSRDITDARKAAAERRAFERKLQETQKLESLGVLAGGIAHDFNNLLTGVLGNASLASMELPTESPVQELLKQIEIASVRAADLCKQMLAYSGKGRFVMQRLDLNAALNETTKLLQVFVNKNAVLKMQLAPALPAVVADPTQMRQVIMNLVINAAEAIGERSGYLTLTTGVVRADARYLAETHLSPDLTEGDYVYIEVGDTGSGMTPEVAAKIFDPFFTTKFTGRGLGLAAVLGIVRGHRGALKVYTEPGVGTTFKVLLPCADGPVDDPGMERPASAQWRGRGLVLIIDDDETTRATTARMLESMGFEVRLAADGQVGVEAFRLTPEEFQVVLLDLTMPRMDGADAFTEIRRIRPDCRVLLMSGFNEADAVARFAGKGLAGFVQKPFRLPDLREKVQQILGAAS
jgi:two-component system, cell cycle sensor histidine kinase and response regulator CckA